jgi:hypothetical protein
MATVHEAKFMYLQAVRPNLQNMLECPIILAKLLLLSIKPKAKYKVNI